MPVVEYGRDDDELLNQTLKKYHQDMSEETNGYSVIVTVPSNPLHCLVFLLFLRTLKLISF